MPRSQLTLADRRQRAFQFIDPGVEFAPASLFGGKQREPSDFEDRVCSVLRNFGWGLTGESLHSSRGRFGAVGWEATILCDGERRMSHGAFVTKAAAVQWAEALRLEIDRGSFV
jgi:hypothetical protein